MSKKSKKESKKKVTTSTTLQGTKRQGRDRYLSSHREDKALKKATPVMELCLFSTLYLFKIIR